MSATHPIMPSVPIELDGRNFNLIFDFNAQCAFEEVTGTTVLSLFDKRGRLTISSRFTRALLWSQFLFEDEQVSFDEFGRIVQQPELNMQAVGRMITHKTLQLVNSKTREALLLFFKPDKKSEEDSKNPPSR
jgi:hypothetical protein